MINKRNGDDYMFENEEYVDENKVFVKDNNYNNGKPNRIQSEEEREYIKFMCNPKNSHNCDECPENKNSDSWQGKLPCGQQNCWVDCHCCNI